MSFRKKQRSPWILFIIISLIVSMMWFFSDIKNTNKIQVLTEIEQEIAKPIPDIVTLKNLDRFVNRLTIDENDLKVTPPYVVSAVDIDRNKKTNSPPIQPQNNVSETVN